MENFLQTLVTISGLDSKGFSCRTWNYCRLEGYMRKHIRQRLRTQWWSNKMKGLPLTEEEEPCRRSYVHFGEKELEGTCSWVGAG